MYRTTNKITEFLLVIVTLFVSYASIGRTLDRFDPDNPTAFCSLVSYIGLGLRPIRSSVYELSDDDLIKILQVEKGRVIVACNGKMAIIKTSFDYVDGDWLHGKYFKYDGTGQYTFNKNVSESTTHVFSEVSEREEIRIDAAKENLKQLLAQRKHEANREKTIYAALQIVTEETEDEKVINAAYEKVLTAYDSAYKLSASEEDAAKCAMNKGSEIAEVLRKENEEEAKRKEAERIEWERTHPEEVAEEKRIQEEIARKKAEAKLMREIALTQETMGRLQHVVEKHVETHDKEVPRDMRTIATKYGLRLPPLFDAWGTKLCYRVVPSGCDIVSQGPDKSVGTQDDITIHVQGKSPIEKTVVKTAVETVENYTQSMIPSVCGFKFGQRASRKRGCYVYEEVKKLSRPFRCCTDVVLRYAGDWDPRLVDIVLVGRIKDKENGMEIVQQEGPIAVALLEKKYGIKLTTQSVGNYIVGIFKSKDGLAIELRNDGSGMIDDDSCAELTIAFKDEKLENLLVQRDAEIREATSHDKRDENDVTVPKQQPTQVLDTSDLDVL